MALTASADTLVAAAGAAARRAAAALAGEGALALPARERLVLRLVPEPPELRVLLLEVLAAGALGGWWQGAQRNDMMCLTPEGPPGSDIIAMSPEGATQKGTRRL